MASDEPEDGGDVEDHEVMSLASNAVGTTGCWDEEFDRVLVGAADVESLFGHPPSSPKPLSLHDSDAADTDSSSSSTSDDSSSDSDSDHPSKPCSVSSESEAHCNKNYKFAKVAMLLIVCQ